jgi:hypothetical protein
MLLNIHPMLFMEIFPRGECIKSKLAIVSHVGNIIDFVSGRHLCY